MFETAKLRILVDGFHFEIHGKEYLSQRRAQNFTSLFFGQSILK